MQKEVLFSVAVVLCLRMYASIVEGRWFDQD
jgi:hypothetical protein